MDEIFTDMAVDTEDLHPLAKRMKFKNFLSALYASAKRYSFLDELPNEILREIIIRFDKETLLALRRLSKRFKELVSLYGWQYHRTVRSDASISEIATIFPNLESLCFEINLEREYAMGEDLDVFTLSEYHALPNLQNLKHLTLNVQLGDVDEPFVSVDCISCLWKLTTLQSLKMNIPIDDFSNIGSLQQLQSLTMEYPLSRSDSNYKGIEQLTNLKSLTMEGFPWNDMSPIGALKGLEVLNDLWLDEIEEQQVKQIAKLTSLKSLALGVCSEQLFQHLSTLQNIQFLNIAELTEGMVDVLKYMPHLATLTVRDTVNISYVHNALPGVVNFKIGNVQGTLEEIARLFPRLTRLIIGSYNNTSMPLDYTPLPNLQSLELPLSAVAPNLAILVHLQELVLVQGCQWPTAQTVLPLMPSLEQLGFNSYIKNLEDDIWIFWLNNLERLPRLKSCKFNDVEFFENVKAMCDHLTMLMRQLSFPMSFSEFLQYSFTMKGNMTQI